MKGGFFKRFTPKIHKMSKISEYLKETKTELKHVIWPNRRQTIFYTVIVIALSVFIAYLLGIFDFIFLQGLQKLISF